MGDGGPMVVNFRFTLVCDAWTTVLSAVAVVGAENWSRLRAGWPNDRWSLRVSFVGRVDQAGQPLRGLAFNGDIVWAQNARQR